MRPFVADAFDADDDLRVGRVAFELARRLADATGGEVVGLSVGAASIDTSAWRIPAIFEVLRRIGRVPDDDYRRTFNLGVGMILAVPARGAARAETVLAKLGESPFPVGEVVAQKRGRPRVEYR